MLFVDNNVSPDTNKPLQRLNSRNNYYDDAVAQLYISDREVKMHVADEHGVNFLALQ